MNNKLTRKSSMHSMTRRVLPAFVFVVSIPAFGDTLYSSGPINGNLGEDAFAPPWTLSQAFTISADSYVTALSNIGVWIAPGYSVQSLNWTISTSPDGGGTIEGSATNVFPSTITQRTPASDYGNGGQSDVYNMSLSVPDVLLTAGTYYLTLGNGFSTCDCSGEAANALYWDEFAKSGNGVAYFEGNADITNLSWSFEVDGFSASSVPEPESWALMALGLAVLGLGNKMRNLPVSFHQSGRHMRKYPVLLFVLSHFCQAGYATTLYGYWNFSTGSGNTVFDDSGMGDNGTLSMSGATWAVGGGLDGGNAIDLSNGGYVNMGNPALLALGDSSGDLASWTLQAWIDTTETSAPLVAGEQISGVNQGYAIATGNFDPGCTDSTYNGKAAGYTASGGGGCLGTAITSPSTTTVNDGTCRTASAPSFQVARVIDCSK